MIYKNYERISKFLSKFLEFIRSKRASRPDRCVGRLGIHQRECSNRRIELSEGENQAVARAFIK